MKKSDADVNIRTPPCHLRIGSRETNAKEQDFDSHSQGLK